MLKKWSIPAIALLAGLVTFAPAPANAKVRFGIGVGVAPVYPAPVAPYGYTYSAPAYPDYYDYAPPAYAPPVYPYSYGYSYSAPVYTQPYSSFGFSFGGHRGWDHERHERHEFREHHGRR